MNNNRLNSKKVKSVAVILSLAMIISACSVDINKIQEAFIDLGQNLESSFNDDSSSDNNAPEAETTVATEETLETVPEETIPEETVLEEKATPTPTPSPTPEVTSTPEPTPTLPPERVDFSELTTDTLSDEINLVCEDFEEYYAIGEDTRVADFKGNRVLLSSDSEVTSVTAINLYLDGFYMEAEGYYNRYKNEALAEVGLLTGSIPTEYKETTITKPSDGLMGTLLENEASEVEISPEDIYHIDINYDYHVAGRLLTITMSYKVTKGEEVITKAREDSVFDIYTGQKVTLEMLISNTAELNNIINSAILESAEDSKAKESDIHDVSYVFDTVKGEVVLVVNASVKEEKITLNINIDEYEELVTRYGKIVLF